MGISVFAKLGADLILHRKDTQLQLYGSVFLDVNSPDMHTHFHVSLPNGQTSAWGRCDYFLPHLLWNQVYINTNIFFILFFEWKLELFMSDKAHTVLGLWQCLDGFLAASLDEWDRGIRTEKNIPKMGLKMLEDKDQQ